MLQILKAVRTLQCQPQHGEDVSRARRVLPTMQPCAKLADGLQQVEVVTAHKVLSEVYDGHHQRCLQDR